jgi:hypothetical protein
LQDAGFVGERGIGGDQGGDCRLDPRDIGLDAGAAAACKAAQQGQTVPLGAIAIRHAVCHQRPAGGDQVVSREWWKFS